VASDRPIEHEPSDEPSDQPTKWQNGGTISIVLPTAGVRVRRDAGLEIARCPTDSRPRLGVTRSGCVTVRVDCGNGPIGL